MARVLLIVFLMLLSQISSAQNSRLRILTENWPPVTYEKSGAPQGMAVELTQLLQKRMNSNDLIEVVPWPRGYELVKTKPNVLLFTMTRTPEREKLFTLLGPIANGEIALYTRRSFPTEFHTLDEIREKFTIGVHRGTVFQKTLEEYDFKNIVPVNSPISNLKMLMAGRVDFICEDALVIKELLKEAGYPADASQKAFSLLKKSSLYFAFSRGTPKETVEKWQRAFTDVKKNGEFKTLHQKWFGNHPAPMDVVVINPPDEFVFPETPVRKSLSAGLLKFLFPDSE
ncbi:substrate-binding periplasmic protein [Bdellovibrio sp. BCCA]|uniref:substrate-binding periplasmic protein n=1 Tax=Bdellovibrio sp. BCCA TaxID=3136281 RepID=UPI0030F23C43